MAWGDPVADLTGLSEFNSLDVIDVLARLIYGEADNQSRIGKAAVAWIVSNRVDKNMKEFGYNSYKDVCLYPGAFDGIKLLKARQPDTSSTSWSDCLSEAVSATRSANPIGTCLWFVTNSKFSSAVIKSGGVEYWNFGPGNKKIVEKVVIEDHTFFRVEGY
ncbi:hypothetical protein PCCS19_05280 [Paenibacillus sp. CCS19]|uniref:cell wall hydrolase n=1 Tax=Paenibacillus sp. CCS19 TaxID=3158387 RepID=UPI00256E80E1|nr:cell wall hydrolase [Paenibacillus cellulosilyticus]GMK37474.1 hypothetical protein PCCS19_05280 [Paenibacillus cellulosilyticus]